MMREGREGGRGGTRTRRHSDVLHWLLIPGTSPNSKESSSFSMIPSNVAMVEAEIGENGKEAGGGGKDEVSN